MGWDESTLLRQAVEGHIYDSHPVLNCLIWGWLRASSQPQTALLAIQILGVFGGAWYLLWQMPHSTGLFRFGVGLILICYPPLLGFVGWVVKDHTMLMFVLWAFAVAFPLPQCANREFIVRLAVSLLLMWLACLIRHNAIAIAVGYFAWLFNCLVPRFLHVPKRVRWVIVPAAVVVMLVTVIGFNRLVRNTHHNMAAFTQIYDLYGISYHRGYITREDAVVLKRSRWAKGLINMEDIRRDYSTADLLAAFNKHSKLQVRWVSETPELASHWLKLIITNPVSYLKHRLGVMQRFWLVPEQRSRVFQTGEAGNFRGNKEALAIVDLKPRKRHKRFGRFFRPLTQTFLYIPFLYVSLSLVMLVLASKNIGGASSIQRFFSCLLVSGLVYQLSFMPILSSAVFRYCNFMIFVTVLSASVLGFSWIRQARLSTALGPEEAGQTA